MTLSSVATTELMAGIVENEETATMTAPMPANWRKSSRSGQRTSCVEVGRVADGAAVRDTKDRSAGHFTTTGTQWTAFIEALKNERFG
ncbi:hypothetical protein J2S53_003526 [Actinopolyspora lacussalsi]|nr:hypothetical protein [Actinopolyspora lacussalsi]